MKEKITVYISSFKGVSTLDYIDKDSMGHPCATTKTDICSGLKNFPKGGWDGYLPKDQKKVVTAVSKFCEENRLGYEIVDIENLSSIGKMKLVFKRIKAPAVIFRGKRIEGVPSRKDLKVLTAK